MIHKYRVDFRFESGVLIYPYAEEGIIIEAHTAEDALTQARIEIDEINKRNNMVAGDRWHFTKIAPVPEKEGEE